MKSHTVNGNNITDDPLLHYASKKEGKWIFNDEFDKFQKEEFYSKDMVVEKTQ